MGRVLSGSMYSDSVVPHVSKWIIRSAPQPNPALILYCLPHAGGAASAFRAWRYLLPEWIEVAAVRLPGRENRASEHPEFSTAAVAEAIAADSGGRPIALFGHSMGGRLAFEVGRFLSSIEPLRHLSVSGTGHPAVMPNPPIISGLSDPELLDWLTIQGGAPPWALADEQYLAVLLRTLRSDCAWLERAGHRPAEPLTCGLSAFAGVDDDAVPLTALAAWSRETAGVFTARRYAGGHFYLKDQLPSLLGDLTADLSLHRDG